MIDWSDPEEMLGLLADYVRDELSEEREDQERVRFLRTLAAGVEALERDGGDLLPRLQELYDEQPDEFARDRVMMHVRDCIEELSRIAGG